MQRFLFEQMLLVNFFMTLLIGFEGFMAHMNGEEFTLGWFIPLSMVLVSLLTCFPSLILYKDDEFYVSVPRIIAHFFAIYAIVMTAGFLFKWYTTLEYFFITSVMFIVIYILVWVSGRIMRNMEEKKINEALVNLHDED